MREEEKKEGSFFDCGRRFFFGEKHVLESREGGGGRKNKQKEDFYLGIIFRRKMKDSQKPSHCNQGYPGMLLVTLGILTHIRFLRAFVPEYLIYC